MAVRIVLADDHPVVRGGIRALIEQTPDLVVVGEAGTGQDALHLVAELVPDVLLLDMELPDLTGVEVAQRLQTMGAMVRVLGLSAYEDERYIFALLECGAAGYLTKDEAVGHIVNVVRGVANGEDGWLSRGVTLRVLRQNQETMSPQQGNLLPLSVREKQVLQLVGSGGKNEDIANALGITERTIKNHVTHIYSKLDVDTRAQATAWAWQHGVMEGMTDQ